MVFFPPKCIKPYFCHIYASKPPKSPCTQLFIFLTFFHCRRARDINKSDGQQGHTSPRGSRTAQVQRAAGASSSSSHFIIAVELERSAGPVVRKARTTLHLPQVLLLPSSSKDQQGFEHATTTPHCSSIVTEKIKRSAVRRQSPSSYFSDYLQIRASSDLVLSDEECDKQFINWFRVRDEICEVVREDSSLSNIQLVEKCFGPQRHDHVFGHGGGVRPKDVRGPIASKQALHHENVTLREKMNNMESEFKTFKELMLKNLPPNVQVTASASNTIEGAQAIGEEQ
ncbi:hypothetical protein ZIOFF_027437 [Zingiber officinale]|uniref:Uncharacterized protein n=1 Tax=Zingiber officinale TaxID=94328 RepID=A0A8J5H480_ZINOF|nr:hypothetical protein ZIOFF_027437 [Zingiber officinale]